MKPEVNQFAESLIQSKPHKTKIMLKYEGLHDFQRSVKVLARLEVPELLEGLIELIQTEGTLATTVLQRLNSFSGLAKANYSLVQREDALLVVGDNRVPAFAILGYWSFHTALINRIQTLTFINRINGSSEHIGVYEREHWDKSLTAWFLALPLAFDENCVPISETKSNDFSPYEYQKFKRILEDIQKSS